jgi:hypothetical protein
MANLTRKASGRWEWEKRGEEGKENSLGDGKEIIGHGKEGDRGKLELELREGSKSQPLQRIEICELERKS